MRVKVLHQLGANWVHLFLWKPTEEMSARECDNGQVFVKRINSHVTANILCEK